MYNPRSQGQPGSEADKKSSVGGEVIVVVMKKIMFHNSEGRVGRSYAGLKYCE